MFKWFQRETLERVKRADLERAEMQAHLHEMAAEQHDAQAMMYRARALRLRMDLEGAHADRNALQMWQKIDEAAKS